jgi:hypothetical protein
MVAATAPVTIERSSLELNNDSRHFVWQSKWGNIECSSRSVLGIAARSYRRANSIPPRIGKANRAEDVLSN